MMAPNTSSSPTARPCSPAERAAIHPASHPPAIAPSDHASTSIAKALGGSVATKSFMACASPMSNPSGMGCMKLLIPSTRAMTTMAMAAPARNPRMLLPIVVSSCGEARPQLSS